MRTNFGNGTGDAQVSRPALAELCENHGTKSFNTGYRDIVNHVEKSTGRVISTEVKDEYIMLRVAEKILLVKAPPRSERLEYSGALVPTTDQVNSDLLAPLAAEQADLRAAVLPFTLNAADYRDNGYAILIIGLPFFALAVWNGLKAARRSAELQLSPVWKSLAALETPSSFRSRLRRSYSPP